MGYPSIVALAVGLAMDATAVAAACGLAAARIRFRDVASVALLFGGFQALMPLLGWFLGSALGDTAAVWDHWIAFVLLAGIGLKMLHEARRGAGQAPAADSPFALRVLLALALATSIDAFAAGITLPVLGAPLVSTLTIIGLTTAALSAAGVFAGRRFGAALGRRLDAAGGVVLVLLGFKILAEHFFAR